MHKTKILFFEKNVQIKNFSSPKLFEREGKTADFPLFPVPVKNSKSVTSRLEEFTN